MLRKIRVFAGIFFFIGITLLFLDFTGSIHAYLGWMAKIQFLPSVLALNVGVVLGLIILTLLFGRIYCSVICPLGVMQDVFAWCGRKAKKNRYTFSPAKNILRYTIMALFVIAMIAGVSAVVTILAPYSAYGRIASNLFAPVWNFTNNLLANWSEHAGNYMFYTKDIWIKSIGTLIVAALTFVVLGVLAWRNGRTYCNTICPVGSILGLLSRYSLFRPVIDTSKCVNCGLCAKNCKSACINPKEHTIDMTRCVVCMDCIKKCHTGAISYIPRSRKQAQVGQKSAVGGTSRRQFMLATASLGAAAAINAQEKKVDGGLAVIVDKQVPERKTPIVPAGTQGIKHFSQHCTACQLCVSVCPNDVLRPSTDMARFMQPEVSYERGYCRPECTKCSEVCPAGAIFKITPDDKSSVQIGHAVWIKSNCVPLTDGVECGNCARHCPSGAIQMVESDPDDPESVKIPVVNEERCIGCGACENLCPARPFSAIYVEGHNHHRII